MFACAVLDGRWRSFSRQVCLSWCTGFSGADLIGPFRRIPDQGYVATTSHRSVVAQKRRSPGTSIFCALSAALLAMLFCLPPAQAASTKCLPGSLRAAMAHISRTYGRVLIISTYRRGAIIAGTRKRSKHARCQAVDFKVKGNQRAAVRWLQSQPLEVITYSGAMHHIHIAVGSYKGHHRVDGRGRRKRR